MTIHQKISDDVQRILKEFPEGKKLLTKLGLLSEPFIPQNTPFLWRVIYHMLQMNHSLLEQVLDYLAKYDLLEVAPTEGQHAGKTILYLLIEFSEGLQYLNKRPQHLNKGNLKIIPHGSNMPLIIGLTQSESGIEILSKLDKTLLENHLDVVCKGKFTGQTLLWSLVNSKAGLPFIAKNPDLLYKGNLNACLLIGPSAGEPILSILLKTDIGRNILAKHTDLLRLAQLNTLPMGIDKPTTLNSLLDNSETFSILKSQPKIVRKNLNTTFKTGPDAGLTLTGVMSRTIEGLQYISQHPDILIKSHLNANAEKKEGYKAYTVLYFLACCDEGLLIIKNNLKILLQHKLKDFDIDVLIELAKTPRGIEILTRLPESLIKKMINKKQRVFDDENQGATLAWILLQTQSGRQFLLERMSLLNQNCIASNPPKSSSDNVLYHLITSHEGLEILKNNPQLLAKCDLNETKHDGPNAGMSYLMMLWQNPVGRKILLENKFLLKNVNVKHAANYGPLAKKTFYDILLLSDDGVELLRAANSAIDVREIELARTKEQSNYLTTQEITELIQLCEWSNKKARELIPFSANIPNRDHSVKHRKILLQLVRNKPLPSAKNFFKEVKSWHLDPTREKERSDLLNHEFNITTKVTLKKDEGIQTYGNEFIKISKLPKILKELSEENTDFPELQFFERATRRAIRHGVGNCGELTSCALLLLMEYPEKGIEGLPPAPKKSIFIERVYFKNEFMDHAFKILNRKEGLLTDVLSWNDDTIISDPWTSEVYTKKQLFENKNVAERAFIIDLMRNLHTAEGFYYVGEGKNARVHSKIWDDKSKKQPFQFWRPDKLINAEREPQPEALPDSLKIKNRFNKK